MVVLRYRNELILHYKITTVNYLLVSRPLKMVTLVMIHFRGGIPVAPQLFMIDCINQSTLIFNSLIRRTTKMISVCVCSFVCV